MPTTHQLPSLFEICIAVEKFDENDCGEGPIRQRHGLLLRWTHLHEDSDITNLERSMSFQEGITGGAAEYDNVRSKIAQARARYTEVRTC